MLPAELRGENYGTSAAACKGIVPGRETAVKRSPTEFLVRGFRVASPADDRLGGFGSDACCFDC